ncbi:MAG: glycine--tRNA ligase subunit beta [Bryobacteraceae bacterium]|nr:glycine--tRNA ligase subunit beta [Bryobacteraceae bacterium]
MSELRPFLLEIGVEEIPHWMIAPALADLDRLFRSVLDENRLEAADLQLDGTPRRLVLRAAALPVRQADREELVMGPPKAAGEGAANGFARKNGVTLDQLAIESTPKGDYYALRRAVAGRETREILAAALPALITKIPWPKAMYWTGKDGARFIRPIRWIACLLGDQVVEFELAGVQSGANSRGHRRLGADEVVFDHSTYEDRLRKNGVILSAAERRKKILDGIKKLLKGTDLRLSADEALLDDLAFLTEFPTPILGAFDEKFLGLPAEVLTTVMRHHQRYFTLQRPDGSMAPHFIAVMNMKADRQGFVRKGNERVLEARFNDARFFWEVDQQKPLAQRIDDLKNVTFQARLGSYHAKTQGIEAGATRMARLLSVDVASVRRAASLAKTDLTTEMVKELTELQGVMGGLYARSQGEPESVWRAVYEHYLPQSLDDPIPSSVEGRVLSMADKLDTLEGCFAIGIVPTGSKDPFGLRRAAQGLVKILVEGRVALNLRELLTAGAEETHRTFSALAIAGYDSAREDDGALRWSRQLWDFLLDRIRYYFRDVRKFKYDEVNAALASSWTTLPDLEDRLFALQMVRETENFDPLAASFKRIRNILKQAQWSGGEVTPSLLEPGPEHDLFEDYSRLEPQVRQASASRDFLQALQLMATLRETLDRFFDSVLVNAPDPGVRANRLALLGRMLSEFSSIADFSEIVTTATTE